MRLTTRPALAGATLGVGPALNKRSRLLAALTAVALGLGLSGLSAEATAAEVRVGHKIEHTVVPGTALCPQPTEPCTRENRKVRVDLWYPADQDQPPGKKAQYESQLYASPLPDPLLPLSWKTHGEIARKNAAIDPSGGAFPVIVFSHGNDMDPIDYANTLERIAAGGFVVAAPYHTNNTQDDRRRDAANTKAGRTEFPCEDGRPSPCARPNLPLGMADRVRDIDKVLDELPGWFGDRVDADRAGVLGHSRGTVTALAAAGGSLELNDDGGPNGSNRTIQPPPGAMCQSRTNPIVVRGAHPEDEPLCWPLHKQGLPRVDAVMGMAIGGPAVNRAVHLENIQVPARLFAGELDRTTPPAVSARAWDLLPQDADKLDRPVCDPPQGPSESCVVGAGHRSFASAYCDQTQAAGASADEVEKGIGNGDGTVDEAELQDWKERAFLDHHTVRGTVLGAGDAPGANNSVTQFCAPETFTDPVDITFPVGSLLGLPTPFDPASTPAKGALTATGRTADFVDSDEVKQDVAENAVEFFGSKL